MEHLRTIGMEDPPKRCRLLPIHGAAHGNDKHIAAGQKWVSNRETLDIWTKTCGPLVV